MCVRDTERCAAPCSRPNPSCVCAALLRRGRHAPHRRPHAARSDAHAAARRSASREAAARRRGRSAFGGPHSAPPGPTRRAAERHARPERWMRCQMAPAARRRASAACLAAPARQPFPPCGPLRQPCAASALPGRLRRAQHSHGGGPACASRSSASQSANASAKAAGDTSSRSQGAPGAAAAAASGSAAAGAARRVRSPRPRTMRRLRAGAPQHSRRTRQPLQSCAERCTHLQMWLR